ncbi:MAG: N-acetylmuramic acid 6-phosphate etherase, partial [Actinotalea sp.]|nr:N-acetylmuramic acid 6-phosphate etherase [Actinotalea sp.]
VNDKLHERAVRMVIELADVDEGLARTALGDAGLEIKTAILMLRAHLDAADARSLLDAHGGRLRAALASRDTGGRDGVVPASVG